MGFSCCLRPGAGVCRQRWQHHQQQSVAALYAHTHFAISSCKTGLVCASEKQGPYCIATAACQHWGTQGGGNGSSRAHLYCNLWLHHNVLTIEVALSAVCAGLQWLLTTGIRASCSSSGAANPASSNTHDTTTPSSTSGSQGGTDVGAGGVRGVHLPPPCDLCGAEPQSRWNPVSLAYLGDAVWEVNDCFLGGRGDVHNAGEVLQ